MLRGLSLRFMSSSPLAPASASAQFVTVVTVYVSEGRDANLLTSLRKAAGPSLLHVFEDAHYNRTGFTLASRSPLSETSPSLAETGALSLCEAAIHALDLRTHSASHPRLGVVDHISLHALSLSNSSPSFLAPPASAAARRLGAQLSSRPGGLPVYFYGDASDEGKALDEVRRALGYFRDGGVTATTTPRPPPPPPPKPDLGPATPDPRLGVACVGAPGSWVTNYNFALCWSSGFGGLGCDDDGDAKLRLAARKVAGVVSERRGGPRGCQALALTHEPGVVEVACNLLATAPPQEEVRRLVEEAARREGLQIVRDYVTGLTPHELLTRAV